MVRLEALARHPVGLRTVSHHGRDRLPKARAPKGGFTVDGRIHIGGLDEQRGTTPSEQPEDMANRSLDSKDFKASPVILDHPTHHRAMTLLFLPRISGPSCVLAGRVCGGE